MRKICLILIAFSLMVSVSYAAPRENTRSDGKTGFTNIAVVGESVGGVPGYIELGQTLIDGTTNKRWYLYVDKYGDVRLASAVAVGTTDASGDPQKTDWGQSGDKVGGQ